MLIKKKSLFLTSQMYVYIYMYILVQYKVLYPFCRPTLPSTYSLQLRVCDLSPAIIIYGNYSFFWSVFSVFSEFPSTYYVALNSVFTFTRFVTLFQGTSAVLTQPASAQSLRQLPTNLSTSFLSAMLFACLNRLSSPSTETISCFMYTFP